jgi:16S rRNA (uracil1498-N3)-methyltransferase
MNRFFLPPEAIQSDQVSFPGDISHQITRVLRLQPGDVVTVLDNQGAEYLVELANIDPKGVRGVIIKQSPIDREPPLHLSLYICLTQREKLEWILQKCTETGVADFIPVVSSRSLVSDQSGVAKKVERWQRIVREAAEQSGRGRLPVIFPAMKYEDALQHGGSSHQRCLIAWEMEGSQSLTSALEGLDGDERVALMIGPEGGFSDDEVQVARESGWNSFTLGKRILRMETAAVVASARIVAASEDLLGQ